MAATEWDECAKGSGEVNPFLLHAFLLALEESGSAVSNKFLTPKTHLFMRLEHRQFHAQLQTTDFHWSAAPSAILLAPAACVPCV